MLTAITINTRNESGAVTGLTVSMEDSSFELKNEYEIRQFFSPEGCTITEKDGTETEGGKLLPSAYFELEMKKDESMKITAGAWNTAAGIPPIWPGRRWRPFGSGTAGIVRCGRDEPDSSQCDGGTGI